jgi:hypothetical protein
MRVRFLLVWVAAIACGNPEEPKTAQPPVASTSPPAATSAAPVASESAAPVASATPSATASATAPAPPAFTKTLKELLADAKVIKLTWREKLDSNEAKTLTINAQSLKGILDAIGADQTPGGGAPAYMSTYSFRFEDAKGNPIATISLYASTSMSDSNKKYGRIDTADGKYGGVVVAKYDELQKKLKALGVPLP